MAVEHVGLAWTNQVLVLAHGECGEPDAVVGKPSGDLARLIAQMYALKPEATLMVGDRCNTDIAFGHSVCWSTCLVLTGGHGHADVSKAPAHERPDYVANSVVNLAALLS